MKKYFEYSLLGFSAPKGWRRLKQGEVIIEADAFYVSASKQFQPVATIHRSCIGVDINYNSDIYIDAWVRKI